MLAQAAGFALLAAISPTALLLMAVYLGSDSPRTTALMYLAERQAKALTTFPNVIEEYVAKLGKYKETVVKALAAGADLPQLPVVPTNPAKNAWGASTLYNGMIAPLIPYAIRGATWYQGESNAGRAYEYRTLLPASPFRTDDLPMKTNPHKEVTRSAAGR